MKPLIALALFISAFTTELTGSSFCNNCPTCWQGFYAAGQIGPAWNKQKVKYTNANYFNTLGPTIVETNLDFQSNGYVGGGSVGYNYQRNNFVIGVEASALGANLKEKKTSPFFPDLDTDKSGLNWIASTKLRIGYAYNQLLPFVSAGWAGSMVDMRFRDQTSDITAHSRVWANGWTIGAGIDYKVTDRFAVGFGYDFIDLSFKKKRIGCPSCGTGVGFGTPIVSNDLYTHIAVFRLVFCL